LAYAQSLAGEVGYRLRHVDFRVDEPFVVRKLRSLRRPFSEFVRIPALCEAFAQEVAREPDVVHIEHLFPARLGLDLPQTVTYVDHLDTLDWERRTDLTPRERLTRWQMRRATWQVLPRVQRLIAGTDRVREAAQAYTDAHSVVVPVGLDASLYELVEPRPEPVVGLIGSMHWYPSRSAAVRLLTRIWPDVHRRIPQARLLLAGWNAERYLVGHLPVAGAEVVGAVEDPRDFFSRIGLLAYPLPRGSGMKIKVLEAMAYGVPVLSNAEGLEGIAFADGVHGFRAESDDEFIETMVGLLRDPELRQSVVRPARDLLKTRYGPEELVGRVLRAYDRLLEPTSVRPVAEGPGGHA